MNRLAPCRRCCVSRSTTLTTTQRTSHIHFTNRTYGTKTSFNNIILPGNCSYGTEYNPTQQMNAHNSPTP
ncbi:hypothetical protein [Lacibacter sediminis]|uniref:Uncharacterized protein n=1 Tax=Lacibacter sediminis TaxID=2760713 RepID=A0A7G5XC64_9BACT|nr:hypothetical protein [Lacibacter sediminis]QNA43067.1 hypothetical protein H4075_13340 [Lacibacter sediminis]